MLVVLLLADLLLAALLLVEIALLDDDLTLLVTLDTLDVSADTELSGVLELFPSLHEQRPVNSAIVSAKGAILFNKCVCVIISPNI